MIVNSHIREFIRQFTVLHHYERSKIVAIDQDEAIKRYSISQIRPLLEQPSMLDDSITECQIEDRRDRTDKYPDEPEVHDDNVLLNFD